MLKEAEYVYNNHKIRDIYKKVNSLSYGYKQSEKSEVAMEH